MPVEYVKRKLTTILNADVEGYSRLMGKDEVGTIAYRCGGAFGIAGEVISGNVRKLLSPCSSG